MKSVNFLNTAAAIQEERGQNYDQPDGERSGGKIAAAFSAITGKHLTAAEVYLVLQITKDVRQWSAPSYHHDSALDCVSYAALKAEALFDEVPLVSEKQPGAEGSGMSKDCPILGARCSCEPGMCRAPMVGGGGVVAEKYCARHSVFCDCIGFCREDVA